MVDPTAAGQRSPPELEGKAARMSMHSYWTDVHGAPTLENMMLDSNAASMDVLERPEILSELPPLHGKKVLELGAGIGRFSNALATRAESVIAVDFVEASCQQNRRDNRSLLNLSVLCEDATQLTFPENSFDLVFSNWLLMYLTDKEVEKLAENLLRWLKPGGKLFFRESCFHRSGDAARVFNPTRYRHPTEYFDIFHKAIYIGEGEGGKEGDEGEVMGSRFNLVKTSCVDTYVRLKDNPNQLWWIWEKCDPIASARLVMFLDRHQYHYHNVLRYEKLYGRGFLSIGGSKILDEYAPLLGLVREEEGGAGGGGSRGARVLDVGCGIGGSAIHLAKNYPCFVHGCDISGAMISIMAERCRELLPSSRRGRVSFGTADIFEKDFVNNSVDVIVCRDFLMHLPPMDKRILLTKFRGWLAPGGALLLTDYVKGEKAEEKRQSAASEEKAEKEYLEERLYHLLDMEEEAFLAESLHFEVLDKKRRSEEFMQEMKNQLEKFRNMVKDEKDEGFDIDYEGAYELLLDVLKNSPEISQKIPNTFLEIASKSAILGVKEEVEIRDKSQKVAQEDLEWVEKNWKVKMRSVEKGRMSWATMVLRKRG